MSAPAGVPRRARVLQTRPRARRRRPPAPAELFRREVAATERGCLPAGILVVHARRPAARRGRDRPEGERLRSHAQARAGLARLRQTRYADRRAIARTGRRPCDAARRPPHDGPRYHLLDWGSPISAAPNSAIATMRCPCSGSSVMPWAPQLPPEPRVSAFYEGRWTRRCRSTRRRRGVRKVRGCARGVSWAT